MDQRERNVDSEEALRVAMEGYAAGRVWTALPGIVTAYDPVTLTATVQPAVKIQQRSAVGTFQWVSIAPVTEVPVAFPAGKGMVLSFPLEAGDEVLLVFTSRCKDGWQNLGGVQIQSEFRMHDLSDAVAVPGLFSLPRTPVVGASVTGMRMGKQDGTAYVEVTAEGVVNILGLSVAIVGPTTVNGVPIG